MPKITKSFIDKLVTPSKPYEMHWDTELKGFGCRITSAGKKTYIVQGRVNGKSIRLTIGSHNPWTCDKARDEAKELIRMMDKDIDPRAGYCQETTEYYRTASQLK